MTHTIFSHIYVTLVTTSLISCLIPTSLASDVFASMEHLKVLARGEREFMSAMDSYISKERLRLEEIQRLLDGVSTTYKEYENDDPLDPLLVAGNPLKAFQLIQRFTSTWRAIWLMVSDFSAWEEFDRVRSTLLDYLPEDKDLNGALQSLGRLQETYNLPLDDLINGVIAGQRSSQPLSQHTVVSIGLELLALYVHEELPFSDQAILWLTRALNHTVAPLSSTAAIYHALGRTHAVKRNYMTAIDFIRKAIELDPEKSAHYMTDILPPPDKRPREFAEADWRREYLRLCRQSTFKPYRVNITSRLQCKYKRSSFAPFYLHKMEYLHITPEVIMFHDMVTNEEASTLRSLAADQISRAQVGGASDSFVSSVRVGKIGWLYDWHPNPCVGRISDRIGDATGLSVRNSTSEPLQMSNYGIGGHYEAHFDHNEHRYDGGKLEEIIVETGDRIATFMLYLSDVSMGGATVFPRLNLSATPVKNAGIFWYNYKRSGESENRSLHAGCPVIFGEKWVANKWIHEFGQEFRRPCDLNPAI